MQKDFYVVGVGASAGGLEALEEFFRAIPCDSDMAFVVIQHLSPDFKSHMEELLARQTSIPIRRVENGMEVEPNSVYLLPAKKEMVISEGRLLLTERSSGSSLSHPIDQFFRSLARDRGRYAVGVILSGTGSDGSRGIREIHDAGGLVMAQDEASAKFDGMPLNATATGVVDVVLPPTAIAEALFRYSKDGVSREKLAEDDLAFGSMEGVDQIFYLLHRQHGLDFAQYKASTIGRRITRRIKILGLPSLDSYVEYISENSTEVNELYKDLLIGVTKFFRDPDAFGLLGAQVIPPLLERQAKDEPIRIWIAACASGEEAYSIAMLVDEEKRRQQTDVEVKIFATDVHTGSLQIAAKGAYHEDALSELSAERRQRYFVRTQDGYQVTRHLREYIVFAPHNIISDAPFTQMDLVTCRNMLIYLQPAAQKKALALFHFALKTGGTLFLGPSESPGELSNEFQTVDQHWRIYTKRRDVRIPLGSRIPVGRRLERLPHVSFPIAAPKSVKNDSDLIAAYDQLLAHRMGPSILISEQGTVLHVFGGAERYLKPRGGRPSHHVTEMVEENLRGSISASWHQALTKGAPVRFVASRGEGMKSESVRLTLTPLGDTPGNRNVLLEFEPADLRRQPADNEIQDVELEELQAGRVKSLENELQYSQENLQATVEEMETSNEELQAANEELVASNEELQSTNEELHSVNEELYTVNAEHQRRVEELAQANDDMDNLLATTRVGVIFLDEALYVRRFTPEIAKLFHLTEHDTGRSMDSFAHHLNHPTLIDDLNQVLKSRQEIEVEVQHKNGTSFLLRILPYHSGNTVDGVVLTLIDITSLVRAQAEIRLQQSAIESAVNGIIITDPRIEGNPITYVNKGFLTLTGYEKNEVLGRNCKFLQGEKTDQDSVETIRQALRQGAPVRIALLNYRKSGESFWNDLQITPIHDQSGTLTHFVGVQHDITEQVRAQKALERANRAAKHANKMKSSFLATMSHELRTPLTAVLGFADMLRSESDNPGYLEKVDTIKRNGSYLLALLNDILDLSKIEAGKLEFGREVVDISHVLGEVDTLMQMRAQESNIRLSFEYPDELPVQVTADEVRVRQILVNLINNAIKFTDRGEVVVTATLNHDATTPTLDISVKDTGIGISKAHQQKLFTPFNQASQRSRKRIGGTGLGLSISKRLAEGMGGTIVVQSKLGVGSKFTLKLPVSESQSQHLMTVGERGRVQKSDPESSQQEANSLPTISAKVLLADDRRDIWRIGKHFLERSGAVVTVVENGLQAVEAVQRAADKREPFDMILMDMQMPVMDGREAVSRIRKLGFDVPIIALTADAMDGERESCLEMGCDEYFPKPIDGPRLIRMVAKMLA
jgi:two-component system CheB/CheR fusion protein